MGKLRAKPLDGLVIGRLRVLRQVGAYHGSLTKYAVHWACCGKEEKLSRAAILGRQSRAVGSALCPRCLARNAIQARAPSWKPYVVGEQIGGVVIEAVLAVGRTMPTTLYRVRYLCCNAPAELNHNQISSRARLGREHCTRCQRVEAASRERAKAKHPSIVVPPMDAATLYCNGHYWPSLGAMGHR